MFFFTTQTRTMTYMDIWMLLCILSVFLAMLEYAIVMVVTIKEMLPKKSCVKIDYWALRVFMGLDILAAFTYLYCVSSLSNA